MRYSAIALALATTVVVGSEAFLIPPNMNSEVFGEDEFALMNFAGGVDPNNRVLKAECMGCLEDGSDGALIFDVVVSNFDGSPKLLINGADLTPVDITHSDTFDLLGLVIPPPFISVPLVPAEATLNELSTQDLGPKEVKVMYAAFSEIQRLGDGEIIMFSLAATNVNGMDMGPGTSGAIEMQIVMEEGGKMVIMDARTTSPEAFINNGNCGIFCGIFAKLQDWGKEAKEEVDNWGKKIGAKFGHCGQTDQGEVERLDDSTETDGGAPPLPDTIPIPLPYHTHPHPYPSQEYDETHSWEHNHHHHHGHHVMNTLYRIFKQVLVPIAIGIVAGMLVSMMGMIVGHFVVLAYQKAAAAWKGKKMEVEGNASEGEALLYKGEESYRDDVPPPEYDGGDAPEVVEEKQ